MFLDLQPKQGGPVSFGGDQKGSIIGISRIGKPLLPTIDIVLLFKGLKCKQLSIRWFCDYGFIVSFDKDEWIVTNDRNKGIFGFHLYNEEECKCN